MLKKILLGALLLIVLIVISVTIAVSVRQNRTFAAPTPEVHISADSAVLARGEYLVYGPGHCADCHGKVSMLEEKEQGLKVPLEGGLLFPLPLGNIYAPNITPDPETGIGNWDDGTIARALRHGVGHDGRALFPFMPFQNVSQSDMDAIISYLRTVEPVNNKVPENTTTVPGKIVKAFLMEPVGPDGDILDMVEPDTTLEYGMYLANNVANCRGCHTNRDLMTGDYVGEFYSGGFQIESPIEPTKWACVTPNLTPDPETGVMAGWSEETFINRLKQGKVIPHSIMPWGPFKRMSDNDLKAVYKYINSLPPVKKDNGKTLVRIDEA